jgi:hypothetical protein
MFAWTHVPAGPLGKRLMVTKDAIVARGTAKQVFVVRATPDGSQMAIPTDVTTGLELGGEIEIQAPGIQAGDQVVCRANERLFGPTPVIPVPIEGSETSDSSNDPRTADSPSLEGSN